MFGLCTVESQCLVFVLVGYSSLVEPFYVFVIILFLKVQEPNISHMIYVDRSVLRFHNLFAKNHALFIESLL